MRLGDLVKSKGERDHFNIGVVIKTSRDEHGERCFRVEWVGPTADSMHNWYPSDWLSKVEDPNGNR